MPETQRVPGAGEGTPFKTQEEFELFLKRVVTEEVTPAIDAAIKPLTDKQASLMRDMLAEHDRSQRTAALPKGLMFARVCRAQALALKEFGSQELEATAKAVRKFWGDNDPVLKGIDGAARLKAAGHDRQKAAVGSMTVSDADYGGALIIPQWSREFVELLRALPVIRSIARVIPNPTGSLSMRRQTAGGTAYWVGESQTITPSKPGTGTMNFLRKKLAALTVVSNDLLRFAGSEADEFVLQDLLRVVALAEDTAFLRGDGTEYAPKGIRNWLPTANVNAQTGTTLATVDADLSQCIRLLEEASVVFSPDEIHWLLAPRTRWGLWKLAATTDTGARPYREGLESSPPRVLGSPSHSTPQVPKNLGSGGNESETYAVHGPSLWIADTFNTLVETFPGGAYEDNGVVVSGISKDETVIRVLREVDFNMRHVEAGACITGVTLS